MQNGFTWIEILVVLAIVALLATLALPQYRGFVAKNKSEDIAEQIKRGIVFAREQAILRGQMIQLCPYDHDKNCGDDWSLGFRVMANDKVLSELQFFDARIFLKTFPQGSEHLLQFSSAGVTQTQNGSFYYCDPLFSQRVVFNQAGRAYITQDEAGQVCDH